jgi:hypothetical protein
MEAPLGLLRFWGLPHDLWLKVWGALLEVGEEVMLLRNGLIFFLSFWSDSRSKLVMYYEIQEWSIHILNY